MRQSALLLLVPALLSGCAARSVQDRPLTDQGRPSDWVPYHRISSEDGTLAYTYDRTSVRRSPGHVAVRSRATGNVKTVFFTMDIDCAQSLATETGTVIIHPNGQQEVLPPADLVANYRIGKGSFADKLRVLLCR